MTVPFDPFAPEIEGYSTEKFYVAAEDKNGHSKSLRTSPDREDVLAMKPHIVAAVAGLRNVCPQYRSNQDVFRDFVIHGLHLRGEQLKQDLPSTWQAEVEQITALAEIARLRGRKYRHELILTEMEELLRGAESPEERYDALSLCEVWAMSLELPVYIRKASDLINHYRR